MKKITLPVLMIAMTSWGSPASAQKYTAPFGVQAYTFRKSFPKGVAETLDSIKNMGFTELEGGEGKMSPVEFKKLCDDRGIKIPSTGTGYDELIKDPLLVAIRAKALGAQYVMCAWIPHKGDFNYDNAKKAVNDFNAAGKILKENGIILCYHIHGYEFQPFENDTLLDYIITNTDPAYVSFEMDVLWTHFGGGNPVALLKKYGSRWKLMHLKDLRKGVKKDLSGGTSQENDVALGTGEIDLRAIIKEAEKVGIAHYFIEDESSHVNTQVPESIAYLKNLK